MVLVSLVFVFGSQYSTVQSVLDAGCIAVELSQAPFLPWPSTCNAARLLSRCSVHGMYKTLFNLVQWISYESVHLLCLDGLHSVGDFPI